MNYINIILITILKVSMSSVPIHRIHTYTISNTVNFDLSTIQHAPTITAGIRSEIILDTFYKFIPFNSTKYY